MTNAQLISTPVGYLEVVVEDGALTKLTFEDLGGQSQVVDQELVKIHPAMRDVVVELQQYFEGSLRNFSFSWSFGSHGTDFQRQVWQVISEIPYGQVMTYREIAETIGKPRAYRAVANACGKNRLPVVIPCHRVVGSGPRGTFTLGGYSSGLERKKMLMAIEKIVI